jgi:hypothetical protein
METQNGAISYTLNPTIQFGDPIRYVLNTEYGTWTNRDTIEKTFGAINSQFVDDASTATNWTGNWGTTGTIYVSPSTSFADSPSGNYSANITKTYTLNQTFDLSNATAAGVRYYAQWAIENEYDYCQFQVSIDGGTTWQGQCGLYTNTGVSGGVQPVGKPVYDGSQTTWVAEEINLSDYIGESAVQLRFIFESDNGVQQDGFYFDDFQVLYNNANSNAGLAENSLGVKSMPNPANTYAQIGFDQPIASGKVSVYTLGGQLVHMETIHSLTNKVVLNTESWSEGMYTVIVSGTNQPAVPTKLVIVH